MLVQRFPAELGEWAWAVGAENAMMVTLQIEMDEHLRDKAAKNLAENGLTINEAMQIVLVQAASGRAFEFGPLAPNQTTIDAIQAARRGELVELGGPEEALAELNRSD